MNLKKNGTVRRKRRQAKRNREKISRPGEYYGYSFPEYRGFTADSFYLTMRDGTKLAADLYLPKGLKADTQIPVILYLTRYVRSFEPRFPFNIISKTIFGQIARQEIKFFTSYGYAVMVVDVRGTGASFGTRHMEFSPEEVEDGSEIVDWITAQQWSNGKVGSTGISYLGTTAEMLLVNQHPAVKACIPRSSIFDLYNDIVQPGGVRQGVFIEVWRDTTHSLDKNELGYIGKAAQLLIKNPKPVAGDKKRDLYEAAKKQHEGNFDIFSGIKKIQFRDEPHPDLGRSIDQFSVHHYKDRIENSGTAIYRIGGWYDGALANSAIKGYLSTKNSVKLIVGPWDHGPAQHISPFAPDKHLKFDVHTEMLRFFDYHLKGIENGIMDEPPVTYYAMGKEEWRYSHDWPVKKARNETYYLSADQTLQPDSTKIISGSVNHRIDPEAGTSGGARWNSLTIKYRFEKQIGYPDWTRRSEKYVQFTSEPLHTAAELTGHPVADLFVASDAKDLQLFVYLDSVDEQGNSTYITEGQFRAIHRKISEEPAPYPMFGPYHTFKSSDATDWNPNQAGSLHFELIPTSHLIPKGHRLRVCIGGADIDHFHPLDDPASNPEQVQVFCGDGSPSRIIVPLITHNA